MKRAALFLIIAGLAGLAGGGELERLSQSNALTRVGSSGIALGEMEQMSTSINLSGVSAARAKSIPVARVAAPGKAIPAEPHMFRRSTREEVMQASRSYADLGRYYRGEAADASEGGSKWMIERAEGYERLSKYLTDQASKGGNVIARNPVVELATQEGLTEKTWAQWFKDAQDVMSGKISAEDMESIKGAAKEYALQFGAEGSQEYKMRLEASNGLIQKYNLFPKTEPPAK